MRARWRDRKILLAGTMACLVLALVATGLMIKVDGVVAPDQVNPDPLRIGDSGTYAFFENGESLGTLTFRVDPSVDAAASRGPEHTLVMHAETPGPSTVLTDYASLTTGQVVRREVHQALESFKGVKTTLHQSEPAVPHLKLTRSPIGGDASDGAVPAGVTWWERHGERAAMTTLDLDRCELFSYAGHESSGFVDDRGAVGLSTTFDCGGGRFNRTAWITEDHPVPALITFNGPRGNLVMGLVGFSPGSGSSLVLEQTHSRPTILEKSPYGAPHPTTGSADLPYEMEQAVSDVHRSLDLPGFHAWRLLHPNAEILGARLMRGEHHWTERETDRWILLYAASEGRGYQVGTERARFSEEWWVTDGGTRPLPLPDGGPLGQYVSLGGASTSWNRVAGIDYAESGLNFVQWGLEPTLTWSEDCEFIPEPTGLLPEIERRDRIVVGHSTYGSCTDPKIVKSESYASLDAGTGHALEVAEHQIRLPEYPDGDYPKTRNFAFTSTSSGTAFREPGLDLTAAIAVPLLILWWTIYFWPTLQLFFVRSVPCLGGYSRVLEGDLLKNHVRASMMAAIEADPGITASELGRILEIGWGGLAHHTSLMIKEGLVVVETQGRYRHYFPPGLPRDRRAALALLRSAKTRQALEIVQANPGISQRDLAAALGITPAGALWHVRRLEAAGLLRRRRYGRRIGYHAEATS